MINRAIFPVPDRSYKRGSYKGHLIHIPRKKSGTFTYGLLHPLAESRQATHLLLYAHPNAVDIGHMSDSLRYMGYHLRMHVLLYEFRGYGMCEGAPEEEEVNFDTESVFEFAVKVLHVHPSRIVLWGRSIGTGTMSKLAHTLTNPNCPAYDPQECPAFLVLEAPFTCIKDCVHSLAKGYAPALAGFAKTMVANRYCTIDLISDIHCPILLIHGTKDEIVPYEHSVKLEARAKSKKSDVLLHSIPDCGHNDIPLEECLNAATKFMREIPSLAAQISAKAPSAMDIHQLHCPSWYILLPPIDPKPFVDFSVMKAYLAQLPASVVFDRHHASLGLAANVMAFCVAASEVWYRKNENWRIQFEQQHPGVSASPGGKTPSTPSFLSSIPLVGLTQPTYTPKMSCTNVIHLCMDAWGSPLGVYAKFPRATKESPHQSVPHQIQFFGILCDVHTAAQASELMESNNAKAPAGFCSSYVHLVDAMMELVDDDEDEDDNDVNQTPQQSTRSPVRDADSYRLQDPLLPLRVYDPSPALLTVIERVIVGKENMNGTTSLARKKKKEKKIVQKQGASPTATSTTTGEKEGAEKEGEEKEEDEVAVESLFTKRDLNGIQTECERLICALPDDEWHVLSSLLHYPLRRVITQHHYSTPAKVFVEDRTQPHPQQQAPNTMTCSIPTVFDPVHPQELLSMFEQAAKKGGKKVTGGAQKKPTSLRPSFSTDSSTGSEASPSNDHRASAEDVSATTTTTTTTSNCPITSADIVPLDFILLQTIGSCSIDGLDQHGTGDDGTWGTARIITDKFKKENHEHYLTTPSARRRPITEEAEEEEKQAEGIPSPEESTASQFEFIGSPALADDIMDTLPGHLHLPLVYVPRLIRKNESRTVPRATKKASDKDCCVS